MVQKYFLYNSREFLVIRLASEQAFTFCQKFADWFVSHRFVTDPTVVRCLFQLFSDILFFTFLNCTIDGRRQIPSQKSNLKTLFRKNVRSRNALD